MDVVGALRGRSVVGGRDGALELVQNRHRAVADVPDGEPELLEHPPELEQRHRRLKRFLRRLRPVPGDERAAGRVEGARRLGLDQTGARTLDEVRRRLAAERAQPRVLNSAQPYGCIRCGKPFGTVQAIETMLGRLAGHAMFQGAALERLKMCADCRVIDVYSATDEVQIDAVADGRNIQGWRP